jgi:hypothetical protein
MGVDGYITMTRIDRGHEQLELSECPEIFRVRNPVILVPYYLREFGKKLVSAYVPDKEINHMLLYNPNPDVVAVPLPGLDWGPAVIPMELISQEKYEMWKINGGPGAIPVAELAPSWSAIVPGYWCVTRAYRTGMGGDDESFHSDIVQEKGIVFGPQLHIRLFT